jgi:26S proteasome regulatory subunit N13
MRKENTLVTAETKKGRIQLLREESLLHFQWVSRENNAIEEDLIIFPNEANFKRVEKVKDGNVFYLDFGTRQTFFWLQEFKEGTEVDDIVNKVNALLNNTTQKPNI